MIPKNETPQEQAVRLYTSSDLKIEEIMAETGASRPTLFRWLNKAGVTLNRRSPTLSPAHNPPKNLGLKRRIDPTGAEAAPVVAARRKCVEADCLPLEAHYIRALRFQPEHVQMALDTLHSLNLTIISNCIGEPTEWGVWLAGRKHFSDPALNPAYPLNLEACVAILENPQAFVVENAEKIKAYVAHKRLEMTEKVNQLVG